MQGTRVSDKAPHELAAGEYGKWNPGHLPPRGGDWYAVPPGTDLVANLASHQIVEHEDGTITVLPSIRVSNGKETWHGFLKRGQWELA